MLNENLTLDTDWLKQIRLSKFFPQKKKLRGHEFHYSSIIEQPDEPLFSVKDAEGNTVSETGSVCGKVSGTFFHMIAEAD